MHQIEIRVGKRAVEKRQTEQAEKHKTKLLPQTIFQVPRSLWLFHQRCIL